MNTLSLTISTMQAVLKTCRTHSPSEACGFVVANREHPEVGVRVKWMVNIHPKPTRHYRMDDDAVVSAYAEFDKNSEEPIAVFHCHTGPGAEPLMSGEDIEAAVDPSIAHLVIALDPKPMAQAWWVQHFIGAASVEPVEIRIVPTPTAARITLPTGPWALAPGNHVRILYRSSRKGPVDAPYSVIGRVTAIEDDLVKIDPDTKGGPHAVQLQRITSVWVISEGALAQAARADARLHARQVAIMLDGGDVSAVAVLVRRLTILFPPGLDVKVGDS